MAATRALLLITLLFLGCASAGTVKGPDAAKHGSRNVDGDELMATREPDLFDAIRVSRPGFFQGRDARKQAPALYVDGIAVSELDALHTIALSDVLDVSFLSGPDATTRYGTGHAGGALLVRTRRGHAMK